MSTPCGVGLHIVYGRMGAGKTNYVVNVLLKESTYKNVICNVPLAPEYQETLDKEFEFYKKLEPEKVIRQISEEHQDTLFIVDEAQMVLLSANKLLVDSFVKKMSQIRQNNQCVIIIAQVSKMLPNTIKDLAEDCYFFENNNVKGAEKSSSVKHYRTGYDYTTRMIEKFTYIHVYGTYESTNTPTTEKPQNLYRRTYIKIAVVFGIALILFVFGGYKIYSFISGFTDSDDDLEQSKSDFVIKNQDKVNNSFGVVSDSLCVRSFQEKNTLLVYVVYNTGELMYLPYKDFLKKKRCHL